MPPWGHHQSRGPTPSYDVLQGSCAATQQVPNRSRLLRWRPRRAEMGWKTWVWGIVLSLRRRGVRPAGPLSRSIQSGSYSMGTSSTSPTICALSAARTRVLATIRSNVTLERFHCSARDLTCARPMSGERRVVSALVHHLVVGAGATVPHQGDLHSFFQIELSPTSAKGRGRGRLCGTIPSAPETMKAKLTSLKFSRIDSLTNPPGTSLPGTSRTVDMLRPVSATACR